MADSDTPGPDNPGPDDIGAQDRASSDPQPAMAEKPMRWTALRIARITGLTIVISAGIIAILALLLDTTPGRRFIADQISALEFENGLKIDIGRIDGSIYREAVIRDLTLSDPEKPFLKIDEARVDWKPLGWLRNTLDIRSLAIKDGILLAIPEFLETDSTAPLLPDFDIRLDTLTTENFIIDESIAGSDRVAQIAASANISSGQVKADVNASLRGGDDRIIAKIDVSPDDDVFDLTADINAPAGGVLAQLAGLERGIAITVAGDGSYAKWQGALVARDDTGVLADLALTERAGIYAVKGDIFPASFLSAELAALVGNKVAIDGEGVFDDRTLNGRLRANLAALALEAQGSIDLASNDLDDLSVTANGRGAAINAYGVSLSGLNARMLFNGNFDDWRSPLTLTTKSAGFGAYQASGIAIKGDISSDAGALNSDLALTADNLVTGIAALDALLGPVTLEGDVALKDGALEAKKLTLNAGQIDGVFGLTGNIAANDYSIDGQLGLSDYRVENIANVDLTADVQIGFGKALRADAVISGKTGKVVNQTLAQYVGENIQFSGRVDYAPGQPVIFRDVDIAASKLALIGGGRVEADGTVVLRAAGRHSDYGPFDVNAEGQGSLASATVLLANPLPALGLKNVELALAPGDEGFVVTAQGTSLAGPFNGLANILALADGRTQIAVERLKVSDTLASGNIFTGNDGLTGRFDISGGGVQGDIIVASRGAAISLRSNLALANARFGGEVPILIRQGKLDVDALFGSGPTRITGSLNAQGISRGNLFIGRMAANAQLSDGIGSVTASIAGRRGSRFALQTRTEIEKNRIVVNIDGAYGPRKIATNKPAIATKTAKGWQLANTRLQVGRGSVAVSGLFADDAQTFNLNMRRLPLAILDVGYSELGLSGAASGAMNLAFRKGQNPTGDANLQISRLARSTIALTSRPVDLAVNGRLNDDNLAVRAIIRDQDQELGRAQMRLANMPDRDNLTDRLLGASLLGEIKYGGPVDALWRLTGVDILDITGNATLRAVARGTLDNPLVQGKFVTKDARLESSLSGTVITGITAQGNFAGDELSLVSVKGKTPNGGDISGGGTITFGGEQFASFDLAFDAQNANVLVRDDFSATVTGRITAKSEGDRSGVLGGDVVIDKGSFSLGKAQEAIELPDIAYREINRRADEAPPRSRATPWRYAIKARARNRIAVRGLGLDSEWGADIAINGPVNQPRISGEANLVRGEYEFAGRNFDLERGQIRFQETFPPDPLLDIVATANLSGIDADIRIGGSGQRPEITFSSVPQLPEDELLARLLFGSSVTDISAPEALQLAAALASFRSGGGLDPINALRGAVGLDRLRIIAADPSIGQGISIGAGKYITRNVYVEVITDGQGYSATQAEFQITRWLSILSTVSTIGRQSINARISRDY